MIPERPVARADVVLFPHGDGAVLRTLDGHQAIEGGMPTAIVRAVLATLDGRPVYQLLQRMDEEQAALVERVLGELVACGAVVDAARAGVADPETPGALHVRTVAVVDTGAGTEQLVGALEAAGATAPVVTADELAGHSLVVALFGEPRLGAVRELNARAVAEAVPFLPAFHLAGELHIGPLVAPGGPCWRCAELRRLGIAEEVALERALQAHLDDDPARFAIRAANLAPAATSVVGHLAAVWGPLGSRQDAGIVDVVDLARGGAARHTVVAHQGCDVCGTGRDEVAPADWGSAESPVPLPALRALLEPVVDDRFGLVAALRIDDAPAGTSLTTSSARFAVPFPDVVEGRNWNSCSAAGRSPEEASTKAVVEALERHCLLGGGVPAIVAPWTEVAEQALHPEELLLYSAAQYDSPGFPYRRFDPTTPVAWVWGTRVATGERRLVLHDAVYSAPQRDALLATTSSGVAAHSTASAALAAATCELVERDAFVLHWVHRTSPPLLARDGLPADLAGLVAEVDAAGYDVHLGDLTTDLEIPVVLGLAVARDDRVPALLVGAGAALEPVGAAERALVELVGSLRAWQQAGTDSVPLLAEDEVVRLRDHGLAYAHPQWKPHAAHLWSSAERTDLARLPSVSTAGAGSSADALVRHLAARGMDVHAVDLTVRAVEASGVRVVRAVVPGLQPIGFGRTGIPLGGRRLASTTDGAGGLNAFPHCFP